MRLLVARCEVRYSGRLNAVLGEALRLIIFKADGSVLVHADTGGYKPLNWMTPPTVIEEPAPDSDAPRAIVVRKRAGSSEDRLEILIAEVISDTEHDDGLARRRRGSREGRGRGAPPGAARRAARSGAERVSGWSGASGPPTSGRST